MICPVFLKNCIPIYREPAKNGNGEIRVPLAGVTGNAYFRSNHKTLHP
jgi:hypothetical protein